MRYKHSNPSRDLTTDLASGQVLYSSPGRPCLPIRLADEVFLRCLEITGRSSCRVLFDPCCGIAYHLTVIAMLHPGAIGTVVASDIDPSAVELAQRNLGLLTPAGLHARSKQLTKLAEEHRKQSHADSLLSASRLLARVGQSGPNTRVAIANATNAADMRSACDGLPPDVVIVDVPYGHRIAWSETAPDEPPARQMLEALRYSLSLRSAVAVVSDKNQKPRHDSYERVERFSVGHRLVTILKPRKSP